MSLSIGLYNLAGQIVRKGSVGMDRQSQATWETDLSGLPLGIYFVKVDSDKKTIHNTKIFVGRSI